MAGEKADAQATFAIDLEDGTSGAAESAASALANLKRQMEADTAALGAMNKAMRNLQSGAVVNIDQFRKLQASIQAKKQAIADAQSSYLALGGTFDKVRPKPKELSSGFAEIRNAAQMLPGPLGSIIGRFESLGGLLKGGAIAVGIAAVAAAIVALTAAAIAGTAALLKYGIAQANARRAEGLRLEGLTKMRNWWGVAAGSATEMQAAIDRVSASSALGRDKIEGYAAQLYKMHLRGDNLTQALEATAIKAAAVGDEGASAFMGWAAGAAMAGGSVKRLADDVRARFGAVAAKQLLDLNVQTAKLKENFSALWDDLKIDGLLKAVSSITALFSQSTRSGQALKAILTTMFQPMVGAIEWAAPIAKRFFQGIVIGALLAAISVLRLRKWWRETFDTEALKGIDLTTAALYAGVAAVAVLAGSFAVLGVVMVGALVAAMPFIWAAVVAVGALALKALILAAPFILGAIAIGALIAAGYQLYRLWKEIDWTDLGKSIVDGIVGGLKNGAKWVIDAVKSLGRDAMGAFKSALGISSPSKAFANLGVAIPQGIESGVQAGAPRAQAAVDGLIDVPRVPDRAEGGARGADVARGGARGPFVINLGGLTVNAASDKPAEMVSELERELGSMLERVALQLGAAVPGAV